MWSGARCDNLLCASRMNVNPNTLPSMTVILNTIRLGTNIDVHVLCVMLTLSQIALEYNLVNPEE